MIMAIIDRIRQTIATVAPDKVFVITDSNVAVVESRLIEALDPAYVAVVEAGEEHKGIAEVARIAGELSARGATRRSLIICIGGGMVTDLGGFVAAIFKRGIPHINVATTLLGGVDASVGGKTGVDLGGLKNELGAFHMPLEVFADTESFASLPPVEILSGFGEIIKTAFLAGDDMTRRILGLDPMEATPSMLEEICVFCRDEKMRVVEADPTEKGLRKVLNLGHTAGHAMETLMLERGTPAAHGVAVAHGLLVALILSNMECGLDSAWVSRYASWLRSYYPAIPFSCRDYADLWRIARHDKKNAGTADVLNFVLLASPGHPVTDVAIDRSRFESALDIYQELQGR